jgi:hypothetical protein
MMRAKCGHNIIAQQRNQVIREVLDWLDRYLGPARRAITH